MKFSLESKRLYRKIVKPGFIAGVVVVIFATVGSSIPSSASGTWANARPAVFGAGIQTPIPDFLNEYFISVSCASAGNCTVAGRYANGGGGFNYEAFTMTSTNGVWANAAPAVFGAGVQNASPASNFTAVSCASAGNCTAVGGYNNVAGDAQAFTMTSTNGVWANAAPAVFGAGVQRASFQTAGINSVSCASAGNCTAVGYFVNAAGRLDSFTMTSTNGVWANAAPAVFGAGVQAASSFSELKSVSCGSPGNCTAVGRFINPVGDFESFTMTSTNGVWANARPTVFAAGVQNAAPSAVLNSVSCASAGNCTAAGTFKNVAGENPAFTMTSTNGVWTNAVPATFAAGVQNTSSLYTTLKSVSCASAGNCTASGTFQNANSDRESFTMTSTNGVWANARPAVFAAGVHNVNPDDDLLSVSCASAGNCTAAGTFKNVGGGNEAFTISSTNGVWGNAEPAAFAAGVQNANPVASFHSVSCASAGNCTASGTFTNTSNKFETFTTASVAAVVATTTTTSIIGAAATTTTAPVTTTTVAPTATTTIPPTSKTKAIQPVALPGTGSRSASRWLNASLCLVVAGTTLTMRRRRRVSSHSMNN